MCLTQIALLFVSYYGGACFSLPAGLGSPAHTIPADTGTPAGKLRAS
jgi:hypothetical protein